jgi:hypothetical protein
MWDMMIAFHTGESPHIKGTELLACRQTVDLDEARYVGLGGRDKIEGGTDIESCRVVGRVFVGVDY